MEDAKSDHKFIMFDGDPKYTAQQLFQQEQDDEIKQMFDIFMHYFNNTTPTFSSAVEDKIYEDTKTKVTLFMQNFLDRNEKFRKILTDDMVLSNFNNDRINEILGWNSGLLKEDGISGYTPID
jgi:hypothetical protein